MRAQRVTEAEALAALRSAGAADPRQVAVVVLEMDGSLSVVQGAGWAGGVGCLAGVRGSGTEVGYADASSASRIIPAPHLRRQTALNPET